MPCIRSERMSVSLVSRLGPATAAVCVPTENSRNYRMSLRLRISREIWCWFSPIIIIPSRSRAIALSENCVLFIQRKKWVKGFSGMLLFDRAAQQSCTSHTFLCVCEREREGCPAYIKIPSAIFSPRILYSQSSAPTTLQNSCSGV